jgi:hypothetical protein
VRERAARVQLTGMWIRLKLMAPFQRPRAPRPPLRGAVAVAAPFRRFSSG